MATFKKADVLIASGEPVMRAGLAHLIGSHPRLRVCGEAQTAMQLRQLCEEHKPRVTVFDPAMGEGFALMKDMQRDNPGTKVVVFSPADDAATVQRAFRAGACGFVTRRDPITALISAILGALDGTRHIGPAVEHLLLDNLARGTVVVSGEETSKLSNRELQIFQLIGRGLTARAVATELGISIKTVETHRERMKGKLGLHTSAELQHRAVQHTGFPEEH